jgi:hypothetical protein
MEHLQLYTMRRDPAPGLSEALKETKLACMGVVHVWRDQEVLSSVNL